MPHADWNMALALGLLLASALLGGQLAQMIRLPRVTAYLLVGLLLGPETLNAISHHDLVQLDPLGKLAMALVLFNVGCHFTLVYLRRLFRRGLQFSAGELGLTFTLVSGGLLLLRTDTPDTHLRPGETRIKVTKRDGARGRQAKR